MSQPSVRGAAACVLALGLVAAARAQSPAPASPAKPPTKIELPSQSLGTFNRFGAHSLYLLLWRRPVLVVSWRADEPASVSQVVPAMLALAQREGEDLAVLFVERSRLDFKGMLHFVAGQHWLCGSALWTCEVPPGTELQGTPSFVLTSPEQDVVLAGDPLADQAALTALADKLVEERRSGTADTPASMRDALRALHEGQLAKAVTLAAGLDEAQRHVIRDDIDQQLLLVNELISTGYALEAQTRAAAMVKALAGVPKDEALLKSATAALQTFDCGDWNKDLKAGPTLAKMQEQLCTRGPSATLAQLLRGLAKANDGTPLGKRALALAEIAQP
jgi:hypothetical protein